MADGTYPSESKRCLVDKRLQHLKADRANIEPLWKELRDAFLPHRGRFDRDEDKQHKRIMLLNETPIIAARTAASGLHAGLTSPARPWQKSGILDKDLSEFGPVKEWLATVDQRMLSWYARSNLYQALPFMYAEYSVFGTMAALAFEDHETLFRFEPFTIGQYHLARSDRGVYDTCYREFTMTVRQMVSRFGVDRLSPQTLQKWNNPAQREARIDILHAVEPSETRQGWDSCYYEVAAKNEKGEGLLKRAAFHDNPILAASWEFVGVEPYASNCPGMTARGAAKAVQVDERNKARAIERHHNPPMQGPSTLRNQGVSLLPGAMTYVDAAQATGQNGAIRPIHEFNPNIQGLLDNIDKRERRINTAFFVDLFLMLTLDERNQRATAEEIRAKYDEKVLALGPTLEQANQMLRTLHAFAFGVMVRQSRPIWEGRLEGTPVLPPPPKELEGVDIQPEFVSALMQAQRAQSLQGIERFATFAGSFAQALGKMPEKLDVDQTLDEYAASLGVPPKMVRDDDEVAAMREADAQQARMAQMAQLAPALNQAAGAAKSLSEAKPEDGSLMQSLAGAVAPQ